MVLKKNQNEYLNEEGLEKYVQKAKEFIENNLNINEQETKTVLVDPLIEILGWDKFKSEVKAEHPIQMGSKKSYHVDYALQIEGVPAVLMEVKPLGENLESHSRQAITYGRVEDVKWVTLTNGKKIEIYNTEKGAERKKCLLTSITIEDYLKEKNTLAKLLSKKSISEGKIDEIDEKIRKKRKAIKNLKDSKGELEEEFSKLIKNKVNDTLYDKVDESIPKLIEDLIERIEGEKEPEDQEQEKAKPFTESPEDEIIADTKEDIRRLDPGDPCDVQYTEILKIEIDGKSIGKKSWTKLVNKAVEIAIIDEEMTIRELERITDLNIVKGKKTDKGYQHISTAEVSVQRVESNRGLREALKIIKELGKEVKVDFRWKNREGASYPGERGRVKYP